MTKPVISGVLKTVLAMSLFTGCFNLIGITVLQKVPSPKGEHTCWVVDYDPGATGRNVSHLTITHGDDEDHERNVSFCSIDWSPDIRVRWEDENKLVVAYPDTISRRSFKFMAIKFEDIEIRYETFRDPDDPRGAGRYLRGLGQRLREFQEEEAQGEYEERNAAER